MAIIRVNPTRMELTLLKKQLTVAKRGHKLLKDKQDEMVRRFMEIIRCNRNLRIEVDNQLEVINQQFSLAKLKMNRVGIYEALAVPANEINLEVGDKNIMNITTPTIKASYSENIDLTYSFTFTPSGLDDAILSLSKLVPKMIELAELEKTSDMLASEIEKTRRRVNAIEHIMIPDMEETIKYIIQKLDDAERSNTIRLMKSKEIILNKDLEVNGY